MNSCSFSYSYTRLSLKVDLDPGGYLEDLGAILEVLGGVVSSIWKALKKERDPSIRFEKFMEKCRDMAISDFGFRSTFNEGTVVDSSARHRDGSVGLARPYKALQGLPIHHDALH